MTPEQTDVERVRERVKEALLRVENPGDEYVNGIWMALDWVLRVLDNPETTEESPP